MAFGTALVHFWLDDENMQLMIRKPDTSEPARRLNLTRANNYPLYEFLLRELQTEDKVD